MNQSLVAVLGFGAGALAVLVDGRHALVTASVVVAAALALAVAALAGPWAGGVLIGAGILAGAMGMAGTWLGNRLSWERGLDPLLPVVSPRTHLFGPRSVRSAIGILAAPAASWASFNLSLGATALGDPATMSGTIFAVVYVWICGGARLLLARTVEDLAVAGSMVCLAGSAGWMLQGGPDAVPAAAAVAALSPLAGLVAGWLAGRHSRPVGRSHAAVTAVRR